MKKQKILSLLLAAALLLSLTACGSTPAKKTELTVFAAASLTETLTEIAEAYKAEAPDVEIVFNFDSSGTLKTQIEEGAECDVFFSAAPKQMDALENGLLSGSRIDLLENKLALIVPDGNPAGLESFDALAQRLAEGNIFLAMGNSDMPAGQYTRKILTYYGLDEGTLADAGCITYGSNVKEIVTQVQEGSVDCGIVYATDAVSANLVTVDTATKEMCGQVIYPAAVLNSSDSPEAAQAFLNYLSSDAATAIFERVGFSPMK